MNAVLPENLERATLATMSIGESGYTLPWAMWVDKKRRCWLHPGYPVSPEAQGTESLLVRRLFGGFEVTVPLGETYDPTDEAPYFGGPQEWLPVIELK